MHHDDSPITQRPFFIRHAAQELEGFYRRFKAKCSGIIALDTYSYEVTLANVDEERKHLLYLPSVRREFNDQEGMMRWFALTGQEMIGFLIPQSAEQTTEKIIRSLQGEGCD